MSELTGILIIAGGHEQYGKLAYNLAMSIKATCKDYPIHLLYKDITPDPIFDSASEIPEECCTKNGNRNYFKTKTCIYDLSPFENTCFLDADIIWMNRPISEVLKPLENVEWTIQNREVLDLSKDWKGNLDKHKILPKKGYMWADWEDIRSKFQGHLYSLHSEFVWFKRSEANKSYFDKVKEIYENPPVRWNSFAGDVADELAFALACNILKKDPHKTPFVPVYWWQIDFMDGYIPHKLAEKYYGFSVGGNKYRQNIKDAYNQILRGHSKDSNLNLLVDKTKFLKSRMAM